MGTRKGAGTPRAVGEWYDTKLEVHQRLARKVSEILREVLAAKGVQFDRVEARVKARKSLLDKAGKKSKSRRKYRDPIAEIKDVVGARVITYLDATVAEVATAIENDFVVDHDHSLDKDVTLGTDRVGYRSKHYVVMLSESRLRLPECAEFRGIAFEIQVRSLLQHAWSEMEHDRRFKYRGELPDQFKRRFSLLAGQLEAADREFNSLAREVDEHAARTAKVASGPEADETLSIEHAAAYLRGVLAEHISSGRVEPGLGGDGATELMAELKRFGVQTLGELAKLFPKEFLRSYPEALEDQTTFIGLLRTAMVLTDANRYFDHVWRRQRWSVVSRDSLTFFAKYGVDLGPFVQKHKILTEEDLDEEHESSWVEGPRTAIRAALENLEWDFEQKIVRAPSSGAHEHGPSASEFTSVEDLINYLNEIGFEPYNESAPRDDGEWVFEYDDSAAEEILSAECSEQLVKIGWS